MKSSSVLITGGAGFIGAALLARLQHPIGLHTIDVVDRYEMPPMAGNVRRHQLDIRHPDVTRLIIARHPDVIFHLAAQSNVQASVGDPVFDADVNIIGSLRVLEGARRTGALVVYAASGGTRGCRASPYGISKDTTCDYLRVYHTLYGVEFTALALGNVYGPGVRSGVVANFVRQLRAGQPVTVFGDGEQTRDYVYVDDVIDALVRAGYSHPTNSVLNIGTGVTTSVNELLALLGGLVQPTVVIEPTRPGEVRHAGALAWRDAALHLGWRPEVSLEEGLQLVWCSPS